MRPPFRTLLALAALALAAPARTLAQPTMPDMTPASPAEEEAAVQWLKASGKVFDPSAYGEADLAPLSALLGNARIIGIGEATHGAHQDQAFKAELIKQLVKDGKAHVLVLEANRDAGASFDRYVRFGEGDLAQVVRNGSFFAIWKDDEFAGLMLWLRNWNMQAARKVRIIGIDDQDPGRDSAFALKFVARFDKSAGKRFQTGMGTLLPVQGKEFPRFAKWWLDVPKAEADKARDTAVMLRQWFEDAPAKTKADPDFEGAKWAAETARQAYVIYEFERADADKGKQDGAYYARRDHFLAGNAVAMLGANEHAVIWAHDLHVMEDFPPTAKEAGFASLGSLIKQKVGAENYASVGFTWSQGSFRGTRMTSEADLADSIRNPRNDILVLPNDRVGEAGHLFNLTGAQAMWIDLNTRPRSPLLDTWAKRPYWRGYAGWGVAEATWQKFNPELGDIPLELTVGHDVIVWFRSISPSRRWPIAPK